MRVLFASEGKDWKSRVSSRFGRANGFVVYDDTTNELNWFSNEENNKESHGAGINAIQTVLEHKVDVLITGGDLGPKAFQILSSSAVKLFCNVGNITLEVAYEKLKKGELEELS